jgi:energy-coupling factor transporter ATP-binding protein EcfA2
MSFKVIPPGSSPYSPDTKFILRRDNWNDFSFQTQYQLYVTEGTDTTLVGDVKILKRGQSAADGHQLSDGVFEKLDENFCSIGQSLDYYERLASLDHDLRDLALSSLRDIVRFPDIADDFRQEPGWRTSLFRYISEDDDFITLARTLLTKNYDTLPTLKLNFSFQAPGWATPLVFRFDAPEMDDNQSSRHRKPGNPREELPARIAVVIGRNGSGKSTLLARLARVVYASRRDREAPAMKSLGQLKPEGLGFPRIVTISYSAFDSFQVPGVSREERTQIAKDINEGTGRYIFCGLRDIAQELTEELRITVPSDNINQITSSSTDAQPEDRKDRTLLKPIQQLADEFKRTLLKISNGNRNELLSEALAPLLSDPSFSDSSEQTVSFLLGSNPRESFLGWSTGHKIVLHAIASIVAYTEPRSIILLDEPETHLHPPLLAAFMHATRIVLERQDAFSVVATHSPVVLQETMARHVHVVRREGNLTTFTPPAIQTFGENIGTITSEVFGLTSEVTDYHAVLENLAKSHTSLEQIETLFDNELSMQARAYVMSLLATKTGGA